MALPPNIATPTLVTGKTNQSQVVDVYANNKEIQDNSAQNSITTVLTGAVNSLFGNTVSGVLNVLNSDKFVDDMGSLINKTVRGEMNVGLIKNTLRDYKNGALTSILEANGIPDVRNLKENLLQDVGDNVKGLAFGSVKGFVDNLAPGLLDQVGIKSFDDCKNVYDQTAQEIRSLKNIDSNDITAFLQTADLDGLGLPPIVQYNLDVSRTILGSCNEIINTILSPDSQITDISDNNLDNAILTSATTPLVQKDDDQLNEYVLYSFGTDKKKLMAYINAMTPKAVEMGAFRWLSKAAEKTSTQNVSWACGKGTKNFLGKITVYPLPMGSVEQADVEERIIKALEIVTWCKRTAFNMEHFRGIGNSVYNVLQYGPYAQIAALAKKVGSDTGSIISPEYADYLIS